MPLKNTSFTKYIHPNLMSTPKTSSGVIPHSKAKLSNLQSKFGTRAAATSVSSEGNPSISSLTTFSSKQSHLNFFSYVESLIKTNTNFQTSETKVFSQPIFINGSSITTQFLITNSNTPLANDWADTLNLKKEMYTSKRAIHSKDPSSIASELIIRNYRN